MNVDLPPATREMLRRLPKVELHIHLEGAILPGTAIDLARKNGVSLPSFESPEDLYSYTELGGFLKVYAAIAKALARAEDFHRVTYEMLQSAARSGARRVEFFISPHAHEGIDFGLQFSGIRAGMADAAADFGISSAFIPGVNREWGPEKGEEYLDRILAHRCEELIGLGLDYYEAPYPPEPFAALFARARRLGLHTSAHAGEGGPAAYVRGSLDTLRVERIDHGYNIIDDPDLVAACRERQVMFTCCPSTTAYTTPHKDLASPLHPIRRMKEAGLTVSINSDDPPMFLTDLAREYEIAHAKLGFSLADIKEAILASIEHSWLDAATRRQWKTEWAAEIDQILAARITTNPEQK